MRGVNVGITADAGHREHELEKRQCMRNPLFSMGDLKPLVWWYQHDDTKRAI